MVFYLLCGTFYQRVLKEIMQFLYRAFKAFSNVFSIKRNCLNYIKQRRHIPDLAKKCICIRSCYLIIYLKLTIYITTQKDNFDVNIKRILGRMPPPQIRKNAPPPPKWKIQEKEVLVVLKTCVCIVLKTFNPWKTVK